MSSWVHHGNGHVEGRKQRTLGIKLKPSSIHALSLSHSLLSNAFNHTPLKALPFAYPM